MALRRVPNVDELPAHKLRAGLSMLGMIFGVGAVIAMLSIGEGAERQALDQIEQLGLRNIIIRAREIRREELQEIRKKSGRPGGFLRLRAIIGVWTFYGLIHIWNIKPRDVSVEQRFNFLLSLFGV